MKRKIFFFFILIAIILSPVAINLWDDYQDDHFTCWGQITFKKETASYPVKVRYVFNGSTGEVITIGEYSIQGEKPRKISQKLSFKFSRSGNEYTMLSTQSVLTANQAKALSGLVPDFYLYQDRGLKITMHKQGDNGLVFTTASLPIFICTLG